MSDQTAKLYQGWTTPESREGVKSSHVRWGLRDCLPSFSRSPWVKVSTGALWRAVMGRDWRSSTAASSLGQCAFRISK